MKTIKSLFNADSVSQHGVRLEILDDNKDYVSIPIRESIIEYSHSYDISTVEKVYVTHPKIELLVAAYKKFYKQLSPNNHLLRADRYISSKIYHNLGRLDIKYIDVLCSNSELLYNLLNLSKIDCLKQLKELKYLK